MKNDFHYHPIQCSFYDQLELFALRGRPVDLEYRDAEEKIIEVRGRIHTFYIKDNAEWLKLKESEENIRLDSLVRVNKMNVENL